MARFRRFREKRSRECLKQNFLQFTVGSSNAFFLRYLELLVVAVVAGLVVSMIT